MTMTRANKPGQPLAQLLAVHKRYGRSQALRGFDLEIHPGELVALLGPNGAGKTTAVSILVGQRRPDSGSARLFGCDPTSPAARRFAGVTPQVIDFPVNLAVREVIGLVQAHYSDPAPPRELLERFGLANVAGRRAGTLSGGEKRRLAVALAFAGRPQAVILDEPTTGLDVEARRGMWQTIRAFVAEGGAVLLTTHYVEEAQALASRVIVIVDGKVIFQGSVDDMTARAGLSKVRLRAPWLPDLPGIAHAESSNGSYILHTAEPDALVRALALQKVPFSGLQVESASLEEAFLTLTGGPS